MAINIRKTKIPSEYSKYKEFLKNHGNELRKIAEFAGLPFNIDLNTLLRDESLRYSIIIKKRIEQIIGRELEFSEMSSFLSLMESLCDSTITTRISLYDRVKEFIKMWKLDEIPEYTHEFLYYIKKEEELRKLKQEVKKGTFYDGSLLHG